MQFYLRLLSTEYWQEAALDALLVWLLDESTYVAKIIETPQGVEDDVKRDVETAYVAGQEEKRDQSGRLTWDKKRRSFEKKEWLKAYGGPRISSARSSWWRRRA